MPWLFGGASHRLNLDIQKFLDGYSYCTETVRKGMRFLRTIKARAALRKKSHCHLFLITLRAGDPSFKC